MIEVQALPLDERSRLIVSGYVDFYYKHIVLFKGNGVPVNARFEMFEKSNFVTEPEFDSLEIIDYGHAIKLGGYEASTRSILIELDPSYKAYCDSIKNTYH